MRMIEADKVIPLVRLLLLFHPNAERIVEDMQAVVDSHTIEAEPVRHGRWEPMLDRVWNLPNPVLSGWRCSECGRTENEKEPYCNCGCKMDGDDHEA